MGKQELDDVCNRLQSRASDIQHLEISKANAYHDGYIQGCEDMLKQAQHIFQMNEKKEQEKKKNGRCEENKY